ncbi:MAG: transglycosylase SLT domain-containing protein [Myxococcota bacterium]
MAQDRWDVVINVLNGPMASLGEQVLRGPVVRIGAQPGPGGFELRGYRGLDKRQCVITAYEKGGASIAPVGRNQVRIAPHANVDWSDIDPLYNPANLSPGCAVHLGPVGRGATLQFVNARRLGEWQSGDLVSDVDAPEAGAAPVPRPAHQVRRIRPSGVPAWFFGCAFLLATGLSISVLAVAVFIVASQVLRPGLGEKYEGEARWDSVSLEENTNLKLEGLQGPFLDFVMRHNLAAVDGPRKVALSEPKVWDERLERYITASVERHARSLRFFDRLEEVRREYGQVILEMRRNGLPEVFAAIPYQESKYESDAQSYVCARGYWQFMPEVAHRLSKQGLDFQVADCRLDGSSTLWTPTQDAPPPNAVVNAVYVRNKQCRIQSCRVDDRSDLVKSTAAAVRSLREAYDDPTLRQSGAIVQLTIASHNGGYNDGRFGREYAKSSNLLPAYRRWAKANPGHEHRFIGQNIRCKSHNTPSRCEAEIYAQTQHYTYTIIAQHIVAACYYGKNYGSDPAFQNYRSYLSSDGYCSALEVPTASEVRARGSK